MEYEMFPLFVDQYGYKIFMGKDGKSYAVEDKYDTYLGNFPSLEIAQFFLYYRGKEFNGR